MQLQERKQTLRRQLHDLRLQVRRPLAHVQWMLMLWERYPCRSRQNGPSHEKIIRLWYFYCIFYANSLVLFYGILNRTIRRTEHDVLLKV